MKTDSHAQALGPGRTQGEINLLISTAIVRLYAVHGGRGPTKSRASVSDGLVVCVVRDFLTKLERTLISLGHEERVQEARLALREGLREEFDREIEEITGRPVGAFLSEIDVKADLAIEVFALGHLGGRTEATTTVTELRERVRAVRARGEELSAEALALRRQSSQAVRQATKLGDRARELSGADGADGADGRKQRG